MKKLMMFAAAFAAIAASAAVTITGVSARQRWPWNNLVDVDFTIGGAAQGEAYYVDVTATYDNGNRSLVAKTFETEPIAATGKNRIVWNLGADYPEFKADDLSVTVTVTPFSDSTPLYCVIDISGGPTATKYPVRYTTAAPVFTVGNPDPCKTTELWLKRVKAGRVRMGTGSSYGQYSSTYPSHYCTLTNDYYLGVFPVTQSQFANIQTTGDESQFTNALYSATRPVDATTFGTIRSTANWNTYLTSDAVVDDCVIGRLRNRTGLALIDLPTEWQWEYACRAGSADASRYKGFTLSDLRYKGNSNPPADYEFNDDKGQWSEDYGTSYVDRYAPNPWGFYGMLGNVKEYCANYIDSSFTENQEVTEPRGGNPGSSDGAKWKRAHGGHWNQASTGIFCYTGSRINTWGTFSEKAENNGFRLCITLRAPMQ